MVVIRNGIYVVVVIHIFGKFLVVVVTLVFFFWCLFVCFLVQNGGMPEGRHRIEIVVKGQEL